MVEISSTDSLSLQGLSIENPPFKLQCLSDQSSKAQQYADSMPASKGRGPKIQPQPHIAPTRSGCIKTEHRANAIDLCLKKNLAACIGPLGQNQFFCVAKDHFFAIHSRYSLKAIDQAPNFLRHKISIGTARAPLITYKHLVRSIVDCIEVVFLTEMVPKQNVQDGSLREH
jgi:hypothetical protein